MSYSHLIDNDGNMRFNVKSGIVASQLSTTLQHNITSATSNKFITHTLDAYGYHVKNGLTNTKLLSVSDSNVLNDCIVKNEITQSVTPLSTTLSAHEVRISAVEAGQPAGQPLGISDILTTNNDASNKSVVGLNNVSCKTIDIDGLAFTNVDGELSTPATLVSTSSLYAPTINTENLGAGTRIQAPTVNALTRLETPLAVCGTVTCDHMGCSGTVTCNHIQCSGTVFGTNITTLTNNAVSHDTSIASLTAYKNNVKRFMNALSQSVNLINPDTGEPFDFTGLI